MVTDKSVALDNLVELLSLVFEEEMDCESGEIECEKIAWHELKELEAVYGNLFHYWYDSHIREGDQIYKDFQNAELNKLILHLKKKDFPSACNVSFLHKS